MNKIVKAGIIGGIIYRASEVCFALGKGHILGILAASEDEKVLTPSELLDGISDDDELTSRIITKYAKYKKEKIEAKIEAEKVFQKMES